MFQRAFSNLDTRRWFDRMYPQTLAIATWLLYLNALFAFLDFLDGRDIFGFWRIEGGLGALLSFIVVVSHVLGGFLMANGKMLGWWLALVAAFGPLVLRLLWKITVYSPVSLQWVVNGGSWLNFMFEAALVALLLHPQSRSHAKTWFR